MADEPTDIERREDPKLGHGYELTTANANADEPEKAEFFSASGTENNSAAAEAEQTAGSAAEAEQTAGSAAEAEQTAGSAAEAEVRESRPRPKKEGKPKRVMYRKMFNVDAREVISAEIEEYHPWPGTAWLGRLRGFKNEP